MSKRNELIWKAIQIVCWLIFAALCVQTGALVFNYVYSLFRPIATRDLHLGLNLSSLYEQSKRIYTLLFFLIIAITALKAVVFYFVLKIFKSIKLVKPFTGVVSDLITTISYYAFAVGMLGYLASEFAQKISGKGYNINIVERYWSDSGAYLMMSAILFVIAMIFQKGIELQTENDLTV